MRAMSTYICMYTANTAVRAGVAHMRSEQACAHTVQTESSLHARPIPHTSPRAIHPPNIQAFAMRARSLQNEPTPWLVRLHRLLPRAEVSRKAKVCAGTLSRCKLLRESALLRCTLFCSRDRHRSRRSWRSCLLLGFMMAAWMRPISRFDEEMP